MMLHREDFSDTLRQYLASGKVIFSAEDSWWWERVAWAKCSPMGKIPGRD